MLVHFGLWATAVKQRRDRSDLKAGSRIEKRRKQREPYCIYCWVVNCNCDWTWMWMWMWMWIHAASLNKCPPIPDCLTRSSSIIMMNWLLIVIGLSCYAITPVIPSPSLFPSPSQPHNSTTYTPPVTLVPNTVVWSLFFPIFFFFLGSMDVIALGLCLALICVILQLQFNLRFRHMPKVNVALFPFYSLMIY